MARYKPSARRARFWGCPRFSHRRACQLHWGFSMRPILGPKLRLFGKPRSAFRVCGSVGMAMAVMLAIVLSVHTGLSSWVTAGTISTAAAAFLALVTATKILTGEERIIYYHHEIG